MVGIDPTRREVVINLDKDRTGHITFSAEQARQLAGLLVKHAADLDGGGTQVETHIFSADCPMRPGAPRPMPGDRSWTFDMPLDNGSTLFLHVGKLAHDALRDMLAEETADLANND